MISTFMYVSRSAISHQPGVFRVEITNIMAACQRFNAADGVTGVLAYNRGLFCQYVEGPAQGIDSLIVRLRADNRHTDLTVKLHEPSELRRFPQWSMAFVNPAADLYTLGEASDMFDVGSEPLLRRLTEAARDPVLVVAAEVS